jgi:hypothetical protein
VSAGETLRQLFRPRSRLGFRYGRNTQFMTVESIMHIYQVKSVLVGKELGRNRCTLTELFEKADKDITEIRSLLNSK